MLVVAAVVLGLVLLLSALNVEVETAAADGQHGKVGGRDAGADVRLRVQQA